MASRQEGADRAHRHACGADDCNRVVGGQSVDARRCLGAPISRDRAADGKRDQAGNESRWLDLRPLRTQGYAARARAAALIVPGRTTEDRGWGSAPRLPSEAYLP